MSKRFGRNQRRRAREALAAAQQQLVNYEAARQMDAGLMAHLQRRHDDLKEAVKLIAQQIGPEHIAFPAQERGSVSHHDLHGGIRYEPQRPALLRLDMDHDALMTFTYQVLDLLDIETVRDQLAQRVHFFVRINGTRKLAYAMNDRALASLPKDRRVRMLSETLARLLAEEP